MGRNGIDLMGISDTKLKGIGQVKSDDYSVYFNGKENLKEKGSIHMYRKNKKIILGFNPISDRIITIRIQVKPIHSYNYTLTLQQQMKRRWIISKKQSI